MANLELHDLRTEKRAGELTALLSRLYESRAKVVVWVADEGRRQILDDYLWTFQKLAFLPHILWQVAHDWPTLEFARSPWPDRRTADPPPGAWAATFDEVHDLIPPGEAGEQRTRFWERWKSDPETADSAHERE